MAKRAQILIPTGLGGNCEVENAAGFRRAGADVKLVHLNDLFALPKMLRDYHAIVFIGGFSYGDHVEAGKILANRVVVELGDELREFIKDGKIILGVCNGFQVLVKAKILPGFLLMPPKTQEVTLTYNDSGKFEDRWVHLGVNIDSTCVWTEGMDRLYLPVRHGEGKFRARSASILKRLVESDQIALVYTPPLAPECDGSTPAFESATEEYPYNPNGSVKGIAGICDATGRVLGMMPHWEANQSIFNDPGWPRMVPRPVADREGEGLQIARRGVRYIEESLLRR